MRILLQPLTVMDWFVLHGEKKYFIYLNIIDMLILNKIHGVLDLI